jgi:hypothetical protein
MIIANSRLLRLAIIVLLTASTMHAFQGGSGIGGVQGNANSEYAIGLWGDLPYSEIQATVGVPNLIADMNSQKLAFTVHDGDLKQGSNSPCNDALYIQAMGYLNSLEAPAMFTPGDNDWIDCDRSNNGGYSSLERLTHERAVFFSTPYTLGRRTFLQEVQSTQPLCLGENPNGSRFSQPCVENRRWTYGQRSVTTRTMERTT